MNKEIKLFLITGASGTGKTTLVPLLCKKLSNSFQVYDFDQIWKPYDFTETWEREVAKKALSIFIKNMEEGVSTVIVGLIRPQLAQEMLADIPLFEIKFCLLDVTVEERAKRLKKRSASQDLVDDVEELMNLEKWLEDSKYEFVKIETTNLSPKKVANSLAQWVKTQN